MPTNSDYPQSACASLFRSATFKLIPRASLVVLLLLALAACVMDSVPRVYLVCREAGGRIENRPLLNGTSGVTDYCVFADGTECHVAQLYYGTCIPPEATAPISPVPMPDGWYGSPLGTSAWFGPPPSLDELVDRAPLIFIGTVGPVEQYIESAGYYGKDGQLVLSGKDAEGNPLPGYPVTDFRLQVEEVIRDDGTIARDKPIILRMDGHITEELKQISQAGEYPVSYTGDRYLFLLSPYPDGETYGFYYGPWSRLIIDGDILRVSNGKQQPLQFGEDAPVTLDEFLKAAQGE